MVDFSNFKKYWLLLVVPILIFVLVLLFLDNGKPTNSNAVIDAYKEIDKEPVYVDRVSVEIAPVVMTYQTDSRRGNYSKGDVIMEGNNARIYTSIQLTCLMKIVKGEEVPIMSENELKTRANAIRAYRIDEGQWYDAEEYLANTNDETEEEEQPDIINDEPEQPKQQPQNRQPNRPVRR